MSPLWDHQKRALASLHEATFNEGIKNVLITSPTGGGKSRIILEAIIRNTAQSLNTSLYTDRRMLLAQLSNDLDGMSFGIRADGHDYDEVSPIQLSMMQTEFSRCVKRTGMNRQLVHPADVVVIDEAHKMASTSMQELDSLHLKSRSERIKIGTTATPLGIGHFYDHMIVAGTNAELRECGALLPAKHYAPDEPDTKWIGKVNVDGGECGIANRKRNQFADRVFGRVLEHIPIYNPELRPMILFAPGVEQSKWFAQELTTNGIKSAHLDGNEIWLDDQVIDANDANRQMLAERSKSGDITCVCNRFVLREGINWPWLYHGIFATAFGSLTSYIQAGGRLLRNHASLPGQVIIQDHGGNWWRHGSLNSDRHWELDHNDRIAQGLRKTAIQENAEPEPIVCPKCHACRLSGPECPFCHHRTTGRVRSVLQKDGSLREMSGPIIKTPRRLSKTENIESAWVNRIRGIRKSKKDTVVGMTFAQAEVAFARDHNWQYPPRNLPQMPINASDWFRPVQQVPQERLTK